MIPDFSKSRILVIGDIMLDRYVYGHADRMSPEAPVPVLMVEKEDSRIGGAGTVLRNISALEGQAILVSVIGDDPAGLEVTRLVGGMDGITSYLVTEKARITTVKTRLLAGHHQIARMDSETVAPIMPGSFEQMIGTIQAEIPKCDVVIVSDYAKGAVTGELAERVILEAGMHGKPVVVDSKTHILKNLRNAEVITPNLNELATFTEMPVGTREQVIKRCREIIEQYGIRNVLATRGREGMILQGQGDAPYDYAATATGVVDVTGAGDTVVAVLSLALASGIALPEAAAMANIAAGIVVGKIGSATLTMEELESACMESWPAGLPSPLLPMLTSMHGQAAT